MFFDRSIDLHARPHLDYFVSDDSDSDSDGMRLRYLRCLVTSWLPNLRTHREVRRDPLPLPPLILRASSHRHLFAFAFSYSQHASLRLPLRSARSLLCR